MTAGRPGHPDCVSAETLAAFVDNRLSPAEREAVLAHAATCDDCAEALADVARMINELPNEDASSPAPVPAVPRRRPRSNWTWAIAGLAAAAVVLFAVSRTDVFLSTDGRVDRQLSKLAAADSAARPSVGRLGAGFGWKPAPSPTRGATAEAHPLAVDEAVVALRRLAEDHRGGLTLRALGVAHLAEGRLDDAIAALTDATTVDPSDADAHADLAAALLDRWGRDSQPGDATRALNEAETSLSHQPDSAPALFNRALALEVLGLQPQAIDAWTRVRDAEPANSGWRSEAEQHLAKLKAAPAGSSSERFTIERRLTAALDAWSASPSDLTSLSASVADAERAGLVTFRVDLARTAVASAADRARQACVARAVTSLARLNKTFDASSYADAHHAALDVLAAARCARVATETAEALAWWTAYYTHLARPLPAAVADLFRRSEAGHYAEVRARLRYLDGLSANAQANFSDAIEAFREAQPLARAAGAIEVLAAIDTALAEVQRISGDSRAAWTSHAEALTLSPWLSLRRRHIVFNGAALTALHDHLDAAAREFATLVVENAVRWGNADGEVSGRLQIARAQLDAQDVAGARRTIADLDRRLAAIVDDTERTRYESEIAIVSGLVDTRDRPREAMASFAKALEGAGVSAFPVRLPEIYLQRSRADRNAGDLDAARRDLEQGVRLFEDQRPGSRDAQIRIDRTDVLWDLFSSLIDLRRADAAAALNVAERSRARALLDALAPTQTVEPLQGADLINAVPAGAVAITYAVLPDRLLIWTITDGHVTLTDRDVGADDLRLRTASFLAALRRGAVNHDDEQWLSATLLPALPTAANESTLIVVPDDVLYGLPFGALLLSSGRLVITQFEPVVTPSLTIFSRVSARPRPSTTRAVLVGAGESRPQLGLPALPEVAGEIESASSRYPGATMLIGAGATADAVRRAAATATMLHFAGHALADESRPSESRLLLAPSSAGDSLKASDIAQLTLVPGSTVVLSACDTAGGRTIRGEGAMTIARPFLVAGASHVVAALWAVHDDATRDLMSTLETALAAGAPPAAALAQAQRRAAQSGQPVSSWAAFEVIGGVSH